MAIDAFLGGTFADLFNSDNDDAEETSLLESNQPEGEMDGDMPEGMLVE